MDNIIYSPLDVPDLASWCSFDLKKFESWCEEAREHIVSVQKRLYPREVASASDLGKQHYSRALQPYGQDYPWDRIQGKMMEDFKWVADFDKRFPEICEYLLTFFPYKEITTITFLNQRKQSRAMLHCDIEGPAHVPYGYRSYIINEVTEPALYFCRPTGPLPPNPKKTLEFYEDNGALVPEAWRNVFPTLTKEYARCASATQSWLVNHGRIPHGVEEVKGKRLVLLPTGKIDFRRQNELIRRSVLKFKDYALV